MRVMQIFQIKNQLVHYFLSTEAAVTISFSEIELRVHSRPCLRKSLTQLIIYANARSIGGKHFHTLNLKDVSLSYVKMEDF